MVTSRLLQSRWFVFLFSALISIANTTCYSAENTNTGELILVTEKSTGTLGRPIRVDLYGINLKTKISDIKLTALKKDFGVVIDYVINNTTDKRWPNKNVQILKFKIYPRKTGAILIPKIKFKNISSREKTISVQEGNTKAPTITLPTYKPYEQQQFTAIIRVMSPESTARLSVNEKDIINDFDNIPLKFERKKYNKGMYELQIGWALNATKNGELKLNLPVIEYSVSGVLRKKFYLPSIIISVKPLPSYLPPTIPIGKIAIQSTVTQKNWLRTNSIAYWNIKLTGNINNSYKLPPISRQIKTNADVNFFPVNSKRSLNVDSTQLTSEVVHSIPFKPLESGFLKLPKIQLQYFEPLNGKIITLTYRARNIFVLSLYLEVISGIILLLIFSYIFKLCLKRWRKYKFSILKREQAIECLENDNPECLREAIKLLIEAEYWPKNMTINQWGEYWKNKYKTDTTFDVFVKTLSSYFYGTSKTNTTEKLNLQLLSLIKNKNTL